MDVGFIGLGHMGSGIAGCLIRAGHRLVAWNRSPGPVQALVAAGAHAARSPGEAFDTDVVFSMLARDEAIEEAVIETGALDHARAGLVHVNLATVSVAFAERLARLHAEHGVGYVAAPVLGRPEVAARGELNVIVAGAPDAVAKARPLIESFSKTLWPMGEDPQRANVVKIAANFMLASAIEVMAEAAALGQAYGVAPKDLLDVVTGTLFAAPAYRTYAELITERRFEPAGFALPLGQKDVRLALAAGEAVNAPLPIANLLRDRFLEAIAHGDGDKDWSAISDVAFRHAGLR
ncbi:MAG: NAD(P)-dependent oxidoreductase [Caulobacteraceae bacterium]|nr:NAD(P)-dependent oxidoreductase [Caulobacteraceae bacterium]